MEKFIGLDAGSVSVKLAVLDSKGNIQYTKYVRHKGRPLFVAQELLRNAGPCASLSITGSAGRLIARILGIQPLNEVIAQSYSTIRMYPHVRTIFEMGGEDSKLILLDNGKVKEFSMNSVCAAGTGSFLDQQAERLKLSIEEFGRIALESKSPPRIAGRCSVFAKSDMIHLQQIATPLKDIVAGLCFAVARNFKGSICRNMTLPEPISFQGGAAANHGVVRAYKEVFGLENLIIPEHFAIMPAIGAALKNIDLGHKNPYDLKKLEDFISSLEDREESECHQPLGSIREREGKNVSCSVSTSQPLNLSASEKTNAYLGIDIGSISTNLAVIDEKGRLLAKRYLMTAGQPIKAVMQGLDEIGKEVGGTVKILGVGTTGSGRYMIADFVGADIVKNEITAQAQAAVEIDPDVDTIFEIGGQDSKYVSLEDGIIVDFEMNKACAAGTGSFIEEQAEKLGISVKNEFSDIAFRSKCPSSLGERCTVFMENSLLSRQQRGVSTENLVAGLAYSIVQNYINRVVAGRPIGKKIFFQGGVTFNKSVVAAFEKYLDKQIITPPNHDVTGAIGMAVIAMRHMNSQKSLAGSQSQLTIDSNQAATGFKGFDLSKRKYGIKSFECKGCDNLCEINRVKIEGEKSPLFYGSRCEKYDVKRRKKHFSGPAMPDLFAEREQLLTKAHNEYKEKSSIENLKSKIKVGIPNIFFFHDHLPFWSTLLWELGFEVQMSGETSRHIINKGVESILAETCFPHKVAHGHIKELLERKVDAVLIPSFISLDSDGTTKSVACPYAQTMPYISNVTFGGNGASGTRVLRPVIDLSQGEKHLLKEIRRALKPFSVSMAMIKQAAAKAKQAQQEFVSAIKKRGREILDGIDKKTIVITGRSYNAFDPGLNLEIPKKLADIGIFSIPMDFLPIEVVDISETWPNMYWRSGQNLLRAAEIIRDHPNLFALYIGNFSCGPDSFIHRFFKETMGGKPFLQLEIDEHSADAGVITRCEAFIDSIMQRKTIPVRMPRKMRPVSLKKSSGNKVVYIPRMSDHAFGLASAFESCGIDAQVMDAPDIQTVKIGRRHVSGKECYPCTITTGDMVKKTMAPDFDPLRAAFFMPSGSGPCRFGQYNILHRLVLDELGLREVPIFSPNQDTSLYRDLGIIGKDFTKQAWKGIFAADLLIKCLHETRPYETNRGETEDLYVNFLNKIRKTINGSSNGAHVDLLREMKQAFSQIPKNKETRPLIGIIGEIFVRQNAFSNEDIIRKVEALGGEVWLAPFEEWIYYVNFTATRRAVRKWKKAPFDRNRIGEVMSLYLSRSFQKKIEHSFSDIFDSTLKSVREPSTAKLLKNASPYLDNSFEGEAVLSMGKAIDYVKNGASGIISAMPFSCMPGTIVSALLKGLKQDTGIPCLSVAYDGAEANCSEIQLEAFMHQTHEYKESRNTKK